MCKMYFYNQENLKAPLPLFSKDSVIWNWSAAGTPFRHCPSTPPPLFFSFRKGSDKYIVKEKNRKVDLFCTVLKIIDAYGFKKNSYSTDAGEKRRVLSLPTLRPRCTPEAR